MNQESIRYRTLRWLATKVYQLAWPIVIVSAIFAAVSIYLAASKLAFSGNPNDLLRSDAVYHKRYLEYTREFRAEEDYVIVVASNDFQKNKACVDFIAGELNKQPNLFKNIFYHIDFGDVANERGLLYLELPQLKEIEKGIVNFSSLLGKDTFSLDLNSLLSVASSKFDPKYMKNRKNEDDLSEFAEEFVKNLDTLADRLEGKDSKIKMRFGDFLAKGSQLGEMEKEMEQHEYVSMENGKILIIQVPSPNKEASFGDHDYIIKPMKEILQKARDKFPGLEIGLTGEPALSEDQAVATQRDSTIASCVTFILIALLFWFSFHEFSRPALALVTLLLAVCWTAGYTTLAVGRLNILTLAFIPMILGLGIDFGIQILGRYEEELFRTTDVIEALTRTIMHTGNAILTGGSTTAFAFYTMCLNDFIGLAEMGKIGGTGILFCMLASLILLPALLTIKDRDAKNRVVPKSQSFGSNNVNFFDRIILTRPWTVIGIAGVITLLAISQVPKIWFDYNLLNLQDARLESVRFEHKLIESKDAHSVLRAVAICNNLKETAEKVEKFKALPVVQDVISVTEMIPKDQQEKLKIIGRIKGKLENISMPKSGVKVNVAENIRVLTQLKTNCENVLKLAQKWASKEDRVAATEFFNRLIGTMNRALNLLQPMNQTKAEQILTAYQTQLFGELQKNLTWLKQQKVDREVTINDIPQNLRDRYVSHNNRILIEIFPKEDIWEWNALKRFVKALRDVDPKDPYAVTGSPVQNHEYIELLKESYQEAAVYALVAIILIITVHFRTMKYIFPTLLPLFLGMIWTAGLMHPLKIPFNPANIISLPLVIGIGVAFGVYAVDRYRENRSPALFSTSTGKAILLSALTTIFGFGSLAFASDPSLASIGILMTIGVTMCLITALYVCPAFLQALGRRKMENKD